VNVWIVYRKGSFHLKERIPSEALFEERRAMLERQGASFVRIVHDCENNPWLRRAFELPRPSL
jgi:hypothetical protein